MSNAALRAPSADPESNWSERLLENGYCIIPNLMPPPKVRALHDDLRERFEKTGFSDGDFYGRRTKRFGGLLKRSAHAAAFVQNPLILDIAQSVLGLHCDRFQLNLTQALEIWPGEPEQLPHRDQDMWQGPKGQIEYLINVMWPFTPYRGENGATVLWPNSHKHQGASRPPRSEAIEAEMDPGSALLFLGSTLHGGGSNRTEAPRAGMIVSYSLGWLKPYENQWLTYPPHIARNFSPELAALVGYRQHRPNLGNVDGRCPSLLLGDELSEYGRAVDELRDEQVKPLAAYRARLLAGGT
ncbi:MAG: phytanoyl-CoA dioxygenase family protein [Alphaproteobacteria bacterium]|nr:phytanoyl-CoA dioxygenase family protein [Alphaproteobacteria bacterium]MBV9903990.1 phytanoyl-CoA dioxygenase family protein [Alphaproteobacteria bacterium]